MNLLDKNGLTEEAFLENYHPGDYARPSLAADMVIFSVMEKERKNFRKLPEKELCVLLIQRGGHPFLGCWALPGGFVQPDETAAQAAARELQEETGVADVYLEQVYTFTKPNRDPRAWVVSCAHMALIDSSKVQLQAGDDAARAAWFRVSYQLLQEEKTVLADGFSKVFRYCLELTNESTILRAEVERHVCSTRANQRETFVVTNAGELAFDHAQIIACALERLRGKISYTNIALRLMPEFFTLTELQQVYEAILGHALIKPAFRRKIAPLVKQTDRYTEDGAHRPSRFYCGNWEGTINQ